MSKPFVFLLPGMLCDAAVWEQQTAALQAGFTLGIPVFRGFDCFDAMASHVLAQAPPRFSVVAHSMGGRVAEELIFGYDKVSSGASSDIQYATSLARDMVTQWGMSDAMGPLQYEERQEGYLGYGMSQRSAMSDETAQKIDAEIRKLVEGGHKRATDLLTEHNNQLHLLANALLEFETLSGEEINQLLETGKFERDDGKVIKPSSIPTVGTAIPKAGRGKSTTVGGATPQGA